MNPSGLEYPVISQIPIDLFVLKKRCGLKVSDLTFTDAHGNVVFRVDGRSSKSAPRDKKVLLDARGNPLITIYRDHGGLFWEGYKGDSTERKDLIFCVERRMISQMGIELQVFLGGENCRDLKSSFNVKGCPFQRSCTIYRCNSIIAQTSLLYKLGKVIIGRRKFRLTIFPGFPDHALIVALLVIFLDRQK